MECHIRGINEEDFQASDKDILKTHFKTTHLKPTVLPYGTLTDLHNDMLKAHLVLIPSEEEPLELAGLDAIAAGIPVLVSDKSGLADFVTKISPEFCYSVVNIEGNEEDKVKQWAKRIEQSLSNCETEFERAARCRDKLLSAKYWEESHQQLICSCIQTDDSTQQSSISEVQIGSVPPVSSIDSRKPLQAGGSSRETGRSSDNKDTMTERANQSWTETTEAPAQGPSILYQAAIPHLVGGPPLLPVVVEIIPQVLPSVETPEDMLDFASALETLSTVTGNGESDETLPNSLLKQIKGRIKTITDLKTVTKAIEKLEKFKGIKVSSLKEGSLIFYLQCTDMSGLGDLWFMYKNGELDNLLHSSLVSEETLQQLHAESISVKSTINIEDFRKALVYLLTTSSAKGKPTSRLPLEYPLYQPHTHTTRRVLDVLHLDGTSLTRSPGKQQELHIPSTAQTEDSKDHLGTKLGDQPAAGATASPVIGDQHRSTDVQAEQMTSELALHTSVRPKDIQRLRAGSRLSTASIGSTESLLSTRTTHSTRTSQSADTGYATASILSEDDRTSSKSAFKIRDDDDPQVNLLLAELNTPAVKRNKLQQFDLYCQIGDLYRTKLHNLQSALQYYQNMLECSQELLEVRKQAKAYRRLGVTYDMLGKQEEAFRNHERALSIHGVTIGTDMDICIAYKNLASSLVQSGQWADVKTNYEFAMAVAMKTDNKTEQMAIYLKLGDLHREQLHEPQVSHKYYTEMLALARDLGRKDKEREAYNRLGVACWDMQGYDAALEWNKKTLKMSQESGDKTAQITANHNIAETYKALGKLDLARSHYQSAMTIAMETGNKTEQMDIYFQLGDLHREQLHEPQESHKYYTEMLALARDLGRKDKEREAYNRLGLACWDMQDYEAALDWNKKYLKMSQESGDKTGQKTAHQNIAATYKTLGKLDLARSHYQSAMTIAMETGCKTELMNIYCKLGDLHREQLHEPQESHKYYTEILALARDLGRKDMESLAYNRLGLACEDMQDYEAALEWDKKYLTMSQERGDKTEQMTAKTNLGASYKALGKLDLARSHYQSAMTIAMETGNKTRQMDIYLELGDLHREQLHEPQESHKYYTEMLALARDLGRKDKERQAYNRLGVACGDMQDYEAALEWNKKYLKMSQESGDKTAQITAPQNIAETYKALGKLDLARSHYQSAMTIAMETGNKTEQMDIYCKLGDLHREQLHEPQESHKYYTEMLAIARDLGRKEEERQAYNRLGLACWDMQDYEAALEWDKKYLTMSQESGDKTEQMTAKTKLGASYKALGKLDLARSHYQSAMTIAMETGNKTRQMDIYLELGDLHREQLHEPQESHKY
ncbi:PREDICTED: tetratricopeptide repeat protein 28-like, partial [Branchiostoma belcheri]|uniref:Tetratricopeptide repeat protein 28-like n=1 Tax=Branchiostoma belcheri TaxID=7741 RepID=A0A6P5A8T1_BRABE